MNRRNFLKAAALLTPASALATDLSISTKGFNHNFNPAGVYGNHICLTEDFSSLPYDRQEKFLSVLSRNMAETIPQEYWDRVKFNVWSPSFSTRMGDYIHDLPAIYWKYNGQA